MSLNRVQFEIAFVDGSPLSAFKNRLIPYLIW